MSVVPDHFIVLESNDTDSLICRIEIVHKKCVTVFGRVADDHERWGGEMEDLVKTINPDVTTHLDDITRKHFHPNGSPKKTGYKYFHHCHIPWDRYAETLDKLERWMPNSFHLAQV